MEPFTNNCSSNEMFFGNVLEQLESAALLDVSSLEAIAADIDLKLENLKERVTGVGSNVKFVAPVDDKQGFGCESRCEIDPLALNCFLTNVVQALECNAGSEDAILKELLIFCSRNGFLLPAVTVDVKRDPEGSSTSLNTVSGEVEETTFELWHKIKSKLRTGISSQLQQGNIFSRLNFEQPMYQKEIMKRIQIIDLFMAVFPINEILQLYSRTREQQLEIFLSGTKKYSVSWADEENVDKVKMVENLETFVVNQLDMLNMDIPVLWKINEYMPSFSIRLFIESVYLPHLLTAIGKVVRHFGGSSSESVRDTHLTLAFKPKEGPTPVSSLDDVRFIAKAFAIAWNWENEVAEIIEYFAIKPERRFSGECIRSVLKPSTSICSGSGRTEGLDNVIWDEDKDRTKTGAETKWPWREQFKCIISTLSSFIRKNLPAANYLLDLKETDEMTELIHVNDDLLYDNWKYPKKLPKNYAKVVSLFDELVTLASLGGGAIFEPVKESFIDGVTTFLRDCHKSLNDTLESLPANCSVKTIYSIICSASFLYHHLVFYEGCIASDGKKPFRDLTQLFKDLLDNAKTNVIMYHLNVITNSILHEPQSNNWSDHKAFFEGERYSYCIQMWSFYMKCIYLDVWHQLPQRESKEILLAILNDSVVILTGRYSKIRPSEARTKQYRCDVSAICDVSTWLIWSLSSSYKDILCSPLTASKIHNCHSLCSIMLLNMLMVSAPLKSVADYLTNKDEAEKIDRENFVPERILFQWSEPCLFPTCVNSLGEMDAKKAVFVVYKTLVSQANPAWPLVCQLVLMKDALLPTLIASSSDDFLQNQGPSSTSAGNESYLNANFVECVEKETENLDLELFFSHVYYLLFKSSAKSNALAHFLMALANRENTWGLFDNHIVMRAKATHQSPVWLKNVEKTLIPFLSRSFLPALEMICEVDRERCQPKFAFTNLEMLPCGCPTVAEDNSCTLSSEGALLYQCLVTTLNVFTENLNTIPRIIAVFFNRLNEYLYQRHFSAATKSPGLKILAFISYKWLTIKENISQLFDFQISSSTMSQVEYFAELVWHLLFNLTTDVSQNPSIPSEILSYIKGNKAWLQEKLKMLTNYFKASVANSCTGTIDQMSDVVAESQYITLTSTLMSAKEGRESLKFVYEILKANKEKVEKKLLVARSSSFEGKMRCPSQGMDFGQSEENPLMQYDAFGDYIHDQAKTMESEMDFSKWVPYIDISPISVQKRVILERQEFLPDSYKYLTDEEKIAHEKLLRYFEDHTSSVYSDRPLSSSSSSTRSSNTDPI
ncbi:uncharacterized protein KIAA0825-like isoform X2 [Rhopilema esculentum]|uniref:uncharacterized protein KIAA0825-like isoform X2 n=1 Tax=Rhopilema esculentum TaxID=499914 RepID=UPI0031DB6E99